MRVFSTHSLPLLNLLGTTCPRFGICGLNSSRWIQWDKTKCKILPEQWLLVIKCDQWHLHRCRGHIYPAAPTVLPCPKINAQMWCGQMFHEPGLLKKQQRRDAVAIRSWLCPAAALLPPRCSLLSHNSQSLQVHLSCFLLGTNWGKTGTYQTQIYLISYAVPWYMPRKGKFSLSTCGRWGNGMCLTLWKSLLCFCALFTTLVSFALLQEFFDFTSVQFFYLSSGQKV